MDKLRIELIGFTASIIWLGLGLVITGMVHSDYGSIPIYTGILGVIFLLLGGAISTLIKKDWNQPEEVKTPSIIFLLFPLAHFIILMILLSFFEKTLIFWWFISFGGAIIILVITIVTSLYRSTR